MKSYMILLMLSISIVLSITFISGQLIFQQNDLIDLKLPCSYNGTFCDTTALCNASINYPNETSLVDNVKMTNTGNGRPNVTLSDTSVVGTYQGYYCCIQNSYGDCDTFEFEITPSGSILSTGEGIVYIVFVAALIFTFLLFLVGAVKLPFKNNRSETGELVSVNDLKYLKIVCMVFSYLMLMAIFGIMRQVTANYLHLSGASKTFEWLFWFMLSFTWPTIITSVILSFVMFVTGRKMTKILERGVPIR